MIRFDNVPPEVMQAMCTPMHPILTPSSSATPISSSSSSTGALYLGSLAALSDVPALRAARITHLVQILDVPWLPPLQQQGFTCYQIKIDDTEDEAKVDLRRYLKEATNWIEGVVRQGGGVLVHCQQGVSRSPAIVIAFLMRFRGMSFDAAYAYTKRCRACIKPNASFMRALRDWEGITGTASSSIGVPAGACMGPSSGGMGGTGGANGANGPGGYKLQLPPGKVRASSGMGNGNGHSHPPNQHSAQQQYLQQQQIQAQQAQIAYQQQQQQAQQQQQQQQQGPPIVTRPPLGRRYTS